MNRNLKKNVIVFGGSGFLGSYMVDELLQRKYNVVVADLENYGFTDKKIFKFCDIMDSKRVDELVKSANFVFNFAGLSNLDDASNSPFDTIKLNVMGNINILEACKRNNVMRYVYASSAYSLSEKGSFYGISKLASEKIIEEYNKKYNLEFSIIRYGSVYGERKFKNNYIYNLIEEAINKKRIDHSGDGEETREYIHASDIAKITADIIKDKKYANKHFILTGVEKLKRKELFEMIQEISGKKFKVKFIKKKSKGYLHYQLTPYSFNPSMSMKLVANPYIDLGQGILDCIKEIEEKKTTHFK